MSALWAVAGPDRTRYNIRGQVGHEYSRYEKHGFHVYLAHMVDRESPGKLEKALQMQIDSQYPGKLDMENNLALSVLCKIKSFKRRIWAKSCFLVPPKPFFV